MTVAKDLKKARNILASRRLHKGNLWNADGDVCAMGALNLAIYETANRVILGIGDMDKERELFKRVHVASRELCARLPRGFKDVASYNDHWRTTKRDILDLFDRTLADLGAP